MGNKGWQAVLAIFLMGPFLLREISPELETYPAVLFPVGASVAQVGDSEISFPLVEVLAVMADGSEHKIEPKAFMGEIPVQYFGPLCANHFGLKPRRYITRWSNWFGRDRQWTSAEREKTVEWLAWRAKESGHAEAVALRFRKVVNTYDHSGKLIQNELASFYDIALQHE